MRDTLRLSGKASTRRRFQPGMADGWVRPLEPRLLLSADVLTYHNDNARTGLNSSETTLTPQNVNATDFGKVGEVALDGLVYAQPLYKSNQYVPGVGVVNVVYVATDHDSVYAFNADTLQLLWHDTFINPAAGLTTVPGSDFGTDELGPEIGIVGTPVIDPKTNAIYVVAKTQQLTSSGIIYAQKLHALDLGTGQERFGAPVTIQASVKGTGAGAVNGKIAFNPFWEFQRTALMLENGTIYIAWASQGDLGPYHGWVIAYNDRTLRQTAAFVNTPNGTQGGIWMSGGAPAADASGSIYISSGNGTFDANAHGVDYGDTLTKMNPKTLKVTDYFTPFNQQLMDVGDIDFGSGGILVLPDQPGAHRHEMITAGKEGRVYLINRDNLGKYSPTGDHVLQELPDVLNGSFDTPAYFNGTVYYVGTGTQKPGHLPNDLLALHLQNGLITSWNSSSMTFGYPGATPSISSNGASNGIVWTVDDKRAGFGPAILRAFDANDVTHELYDSTQAGNRDTAGTAVKFAVPTVANGRVYVGGSNNLTVYGLLSS